MTGFRRTLVGVLISLLTVVLFPGAAKKNLVIRRIDIVDVRSGTILPSRTVFIDGNRIAKVTASDVEPDVGAMVVEGTGKYLIPGLWNMHVHLSETRPETLGVMVAWGVTSVRDMGTPMSLIRSYREFAVAGMAAPRIKAPGMMITNPMIWKMMEKTIPEEIWKAEMRRRIKVGTPEEARDAVRLAKKDGADFVKLHWNATPETYNALSDECRTQDLTFAGHDPLGGLTLEEIAASGQRSIEHIDGSFPGVLAKADDARRTHLYQVFKENDTHFVPTVTTFVGLAKFEGVKGLEERMKICLAGEGGRYVTPKMEEFWRMFLDMFYQQLPPVSMFEPAFSQLRAMHAAEIPLMPGTDLGAPLIYPGSSLHDELAEFVNRLAMTPAEAMRSATLVPARFFGIDKDIGAVEEGMLADLVLLEANPLESITNIRKIHSVVIDGHFINSQHRRNLLEQAVIRRK